MPICRRAATIASRCCVCVHAAAGNYSRHVAVLLATDAIFYTIKRCQHERATSRHTVDNIGQCFLLAPRRRGETPVYRSNKRRHVGSGERTIATEDKILRLIWPRVEMARHVRAISSFINVTNVSRIVPNHCPRVQAITNTVKRNCSIYTCAYARVFTIPVGLKSGLCSFSHLPSQFVISYSTSQSNFCYVDWGSKKFLMLD